MVKVVGSRAFSRCFHNRVKIIIVIFCFVIGRMIGRVFLRLLYSISWRVCWGNMTTSAPSPLLFLLCGVMPRPHNYQIVPLQNEAG